MHSLTVLWKGLEAVQGEAARFCPASACWRLVRLSVSMTLAFEAARQTLSCSNQQHLHSLTAALSQDVLSSPSHLHFTKRFLADPFSNSTTSTVSSLQMYLSPLSRGQSTIYNNIHIVCGITKGFHAEQAFLCLMVLESSAGVLLAFSRMVVPDHRSCLTATIVACFDSRLPRRDGSLIPTRLSRQARQVC